MWLSQSIPTLLSHITVSFNSFHNLTKPHPETGGEMLLLLLQNERLFQKSSALLFNHIIHILISKSFMMIMLFLTALLVLVLLSLGVLSSLSPVLLPHIICFTRFCLSPTKCKNHYYSYRNKSLIQNQKKETQCGFLLTLL